MFVRASVTQTNRNTCPGWCRRPTARLELFLLIDEHLHRGANGGNRETVMIELPQEVRDFHRYHSGLVEPWDGPAGLVFTDGHVVGAALDRNGLRPARYAVCEDGFVVCSSEAGAVSLDGPGRRRGKLGPGR